MTNIAFSVYMGVADMHAGQGCGCDRPIKVRVRILWMRASKKIFAPSIAGVWSIELLFSSVNKRSSPRETYSQSAAFSYANSLDVDMSTILEEVHTIGEQGTTPAFNNLQAAPPLLTTTTMSRYPDPEVPAFDLGLLPITMAQARPSTARRNSSASRSDRNTNCPRSSRRNNGNSSSYPPSPTSVPVKRRSNRRSAAPTHKYLSKTNGKARK